MTKVHPHRQVNVHLDTVDDADVIERIEAQPSMVSYVRELVRRDIHDERLECAALKASELQTENDKLRELVRNVYAIHWSGLDCTECPWIGECDTYGGCPWLGIMHDHMHELGIEVDS